MGVGGSRTASQVAKGFPKEVISSLLVLGPALGKHAELQQSDPSVLGWRDVHCSMGSLCLARLCVCVHLCGPVPGHWLLSFFRGLVRRH